MDKDNKIKETVKQKFTEYLTEKKGRKTPERYAILDLIYSESGHFNMDSLYEAMNARHFRVSRATLYNTMQLLLDCKLVVKHQFGKNLSFYEKTYNNDFHHHLICIACNKVQEYRDAELKSIIERKKISRFTPMHHNLYIYGICSVCSRKMREQNKDKKQKNKDKKSKDKKLRIKKNNV